MRYRDAKNCTMGMRSTVSYPTPEGGGFGYF